MKRIKRLDEELKLMIKEGRLRCFDNGGRTLDRYLLLIEDNVYCASSNPLHKKRGIFDYVGTQYEIDLEGEREIQYGRLPPAIKTEVLRLLEL